MENKKCTLNWWAILAAMLFGVLTGVLGTVAFKKLFGARKYQHHEREGCDCCDYDFDDYYDDDLLYRDNEDNMLEDETDALSF